jgi:hypothetical protein
MMRTIEIFLVIIIITAAFIISSLFAVLPSPRQVSPLNLRRLALTTLQTLDVDHDLSETVFNESNNLAWGQLKIALSACLPPNIVYNLTAYEVSSGSGTELYTPIKSISNAESLGIASDAGSYLVASSNVTFKVIPEKIGEHGGGGTLYILNCSDANGWWITGYTAQSLAEDLYGMLSPYFQTTIMVQNTTQLGQILNGTKISDLPHENVTNSVIINTFGEAVPIPAGYYAEQGYYAPRDSYSLYCHILGQKVRYYNWTWVSIVGYPLYYVSNTGLFPNNHNTWGIYGMKHVGSSGFNAFLDGLDGQEYGDWWWDWRDREWVYDSGWITGDPDDEEGLASVPLSSEEIYYCNYYGIYPSAYHTATRALPSSILNDYQLTVTSYVFDPIFDPDENWDWIAGAVYRRDVSGGFLALGLTRTPDIRLTALGLLSDYKPRLYRSEYTAAGTSRLVILQLGQVGGI